VRRLKRPMTVLLFASTTFARDVRRQVLAVRATT
jgi:hypothetical protein